MQQYNLYSTANGQCKRKDYKINNRLDPVQCTSLGLYITDKNASYIECDEAFIIKQIWFTTIK